MVKRVGAKCFQIWGATKVYPVLTWGGGAEVSDPQCFKFCSQSPFPVINDRSLAYIEDYFLITTFMKFLIIDALLSLQIIHPLWHKATFQKRRMYVTLVLVWLVGPVYNFPLTGLTSGVNMADGTCLHIMAFHNTKRIQEGGSWGSGPPHPPFWGTPKLHKEGKKNIMRVRAITPHFST